jgi:hypothetical protein
VLQHEYFPIDVTDITTSPVPATVGPMQIAANPFRWKPKVSVHDLFNAVKGTYVSPLTNWQVTDFPPYMQDSIHGYYSGSPLDPYGDANLAADDGQRRYLDIQLPFTISVATAQAAGEARTDATPPAGNRDVPVQPVRCSDGGSRRGSHDASVLQLGSETPGDPGMALYLRGSTMGNAASKSSNNPKS